MTFAQVLLVADEIDAEHMILTCQIEKGFVKRCVQKRTWSCTQQCLCSCLLCAIVSACL